MGTEGKNIKPSWKETVGTWERRVIKNANRRRLSP